MGIPSVEGEIQPQRRGVGSMGGKWRFMFASAGNSNVLEQHVDGVVPSVGYRLFDHFLSVPGSALPLWLAEKDVSSAGTPVIGYVADAAGGVWSAAHDSQDEAQAIGFTGGDHLAFDPTKDCLIEARVKLVTADMSADQRFVFGFASDYATDLDTVARNAWFRVEGGSANLLWEVDDGTTDDDDNDTGVDVVDDTYIVLRVLIQGLVCHFSVNGVRVASSATTVLAANMQPFAILQKDAGADVDGFSVDYITVIGAV